MALAAVARLLVAILVLGPLFASGYDAEVDVPRNGYIDIEGRFWNRENGYALALGVSSDAKWVLVALLPERNVWGTPASLPNRGSGHRAVASMLVLQVAAVPGQDSNQPAESQPRTFSVCIAHPPPTPTPPQPLAAPLFDFDLRDVTRANASSASTAAHLAPLVATGLFPIFVAREPEAGEAGLWASDGTWSAVVVAEFYQLQEPYLRYSTVRAVAAEPPTADTPPPGGSGQVGFASLAVRVTRSLAAPS